MDKVVYNKKIYNKIDCAFIVNNWVPLEFLVYDPQEQKFTEKKENGYMFLDGKLQPCYLASFSNTWSFYFSMNSSVNNKCREYFNSSEERKVIIRNILAVMDPVFCTSFIALCKLNKFEYIFTTFGYSESFIKIWTTGKLPSFLVKKGGNINLKSRGDFTQDHEENCNVRGKGLNDFPHSVAQWDRLTKSKLRADFDKESLPANVSDFGRAVSFLLSKYSWGLEWELSGKTLPNAELSKTYTLPTTDGSLRRKDMFSEDRYTPAEYVTLPLLSQADILKGVSNGARAIKKYGKYDQCCSLHVHIGGQPVEKDFTIALMILCQVVQDEIFTMFPYYKLDPSVAGIRKIYSAKLPENTRKNLYLHKKFLYKSGDKDTFHESLKSVFNTFFKFWSGGTEVSPDYNVGNIIKGAISHPQGNNKWNHTQRYHWINFMNYLFSNSRTIELRISPMTDSEDKVYALMLLLYALIEYASKNKVEIISNSSFKVSLNDIFEILPIGIVKNTMVQYVLDRKNQSFNKDKQGKKEKKIICRQIIDKEDTLGKDQL
tara:strand:+ start:13183 stop:14814 length:1632 start_codon:yes stop_codon:yes gene_type:complete